MSLLEENTNHLLCVNCATPAKAACKHCLLVVYCGRDCQKCDWNSHKVLCKSSLSSNAWQPDWVSENRAPTFVSNGPSLVQFGGKKFFWGNIPALDILKLEDNEGKSYGRDLHLLFAASGDLRNVVKTVVSVPQSYTGTIYLVINDRDFDVVARNIIIIMVAMTVDDVSTATQCMLHIWYSAMIRQADHKILNELVLPLIEDVNIKIQNRASDRMFRKTWIFHHSKLSVALTKESWGSLISYCASPAALTAARAKEIRQAVTMANVRKDYRHRKLLAQFPNERLCRIRFQEDGIMLPYGHPRVNFSTPNPTFFQSEEWPMMDSADPIDGWSLSEVREISIPAANDIYGKLYFFLLKMFHSFHRLLRERSSEFCILNVDATTLRDHVEENRFARLEVSNISDAGYLGIAKVAGFLGPLLQDPTDNKHATLITLFMNAVQEIYEDFKQDPKTVKSELTRVMQYRLPVAPRLSQHDAQATLNVAAMDLVRDGDRFFKRYMVELEFGKVEELSGLKMKETHSIVSKWPFRLKLQHHQNGAKEEFAALLASGLFSTERYVEWKRVT